MKNSDEALIVAALQGTASDEEAADLGTKLTESAELRECLLDHLDVQAFLHAEAKAGAFSEDPVALFKQLEGTPASNKIIPFTRRHWIRAATAASAAAACLLIGFVLMSPRPLTAAAVLQQMLDASLQAGDRTYSFSVLRGNEDRSRKGGEAVTLEGATVHLRGADQFVMVEDLADGSGKRVTGYDGQQSWTFSGQDPVQISDDPNAFRRVIPASQQDLPFFNLHEALSQLLDGYRIKLSDHDATETHLLRAYKKARGVRGPREMHVWFDPESGLVRRLELVPPGARHRDGPRRIRLELVEQASLPPDFFSHGSHHEPDRPVETEWRRRSR